MSKPASTVLTIPLATQQVEPEPRPVGRGEQIAGTVLQLHGHAFHDLLQCGNDDAGVGHRTHERRELNSDAGDPQNEKEERRGSREKSHEDERHGREQGDLGNPDFRGELGVGSVTPNCSLM
jgi:hypothetical protein